MSKHPVPVGYSAQAYVVLLSNGTWKSLESYQKANPKKGPIFRDPRSKKQARRWEKTARLALRRLDRGGKFL